jgi:hypothetical protein
MGAWPGLLWVWGEASVQRQEPKVLLIQAAVLLVVCWAVQRFWGERWGGPVLWRPQARGGLRTTGWIVLVLLALVGLRWLVRDRPLVRSEMLSAPQDLATVLMVASYGACFIEVVVRAGWMTWAAGVTRSPWRAVMLTALCVGLWDQWTLPGHPAGAGGPWSLSVLAVVAAQEVVLGVLAYRHGVAASILSRALLSLRWLALGGG